MANYYKRVPIYVPAWAEALGVRSPVEMYFIVEENGELRFRPPRPEILQQMMRESRRKQEQAEQPAVSVDEAPNQKQAAQSEPEVDFPKLTEQKNAKQVEPPRSRTNRSRPKRRRTKPNNPYSQGKGAVQTRSLLIDLDQYPSWQPYNIIKHHPGGMFYWNPHQVTTRRFPHQSGNGYGCNGTLVQTLLSSHRSFNANLAHWLMNNQHFIPMDWRRNGRRIFFWDTIFEDRHGQQCVMFMTCSHNLFKTGYHPVNALFNSNDFACCRI